MDYVFKKPADIVQNTDWFLVQYEKGPHKFIRKIARSDEIIWNQHAQIRNNDPYYKNHVMIREYDQIFLGCILYRAVDKQDALFHNQFLQHYFMHLLNTQFEVNIVMQQLHFNSNFWVLVMYNTETEVALNGEQRVFEIFHRTELILKKDHQLNNIIAFIQGEQSTYKSIVLKVTSNLQDLMLFMAYIKNVAIEIFRSITKMVLNPKNFSYIKNSLEYQRREIRLRIIDKCQTQSPITFEHVRAIIDEICENDGIPATRTSTSPMFPASLLNHNYDCFNMNSKVSSASSSPPTTSSSSSSSVEDKQQFKGYSAKRHLFHEEHKYNEFSTKADDTSLQQDEDSQEEYPKSFHDHIILGPNGTEIDTRSYSSIVWSSATLATRKLLYFVFGHDILATHTLTGKKPLDQYGRERPAKAQLDPMKVADIIHCVRSKFKCTERDIRAAITNKCTATSRKFKKRHEKQLDSLKAIH